MNESSWELVSRAFAETMTNYLQCTYNPNTPSGFANTLAKHLKSKYRIQSCDFIGEGRNVSGFNLWKYMACPGPANERVLYEDIHNFAISKGLESILEPEDVPDEERFKRPAVALPRRKKDKIVRSSLKITIGEQVLHVSGYVDPSYAGRIGVTLH